MKALVNPTTGMVVHFTDNGDAILNLQAKRFDNRIFMNGIPEGATVVTTTLVEDVVPDYDPSYQLIAKTYNYDGTNIIETNTVQEWRTQAEAEAEAAANAIDVSQDSA